MGEKNCVILAFEKLFSFLNIIEVNLPEVLEKELYEKRFISEKDVKDIVNKLKNVLSQYNLSIDIYRLYNDKEIISYFSKEEIEKEKKQQKERAYEILNENFGILLLDGDDNGHAYIFYKTKDLKPHEIIIIDPRKEKTEKVEIEKIYKRIDYIIFLSKILS